MAHSEKQRDGDSILPTDPEGESRSRPDRPPLGKDPTSLAQHEFEVMSRRMRTVTDRKQQRLTAACPVDIRDCGSHFLVSAEVPDIREDQVHCDVRNRRVLHLRVDRPNPPDHGMAYLSERRYESAERDFLLPADVTCQGVRRKLRKGVLHIRLPKADAETSGG
jgi:HSP20 family molecular chaperone IbpA